MGVIKNNAKIVGHANMGAINTVVEIAGPVYANIIKINTDVEIAEPVYVNIIKINSVVEIVGPVYVNIKILALVAKSANT